jgi:uncharacterized protein YceH (UPF0502 family)
VFDLDAVQLRVLGCLLEKQRTTPDAYPLTLNALRLACNQTTNRDPVTSYDEAEVRDAIQRLGQRRLTRMASGPGSRAPKYRHLVEEELGLGAPEQALLSVLLVRGPQTLGELKGRSERLHAFPDMAAVEATLERLSARELGGWLERRPGQKEARYAHRLGSSVAAAPAVEEAVHPWAENPADTREPDDERLASLAAELASLRNDVAALREELAKLRGELGS